MTSLESQIASRKHNNFNILRLLLALLVIFSHSFPLALGNGLRGEDPDPFNRWTQSQLSFGTMSVYAFFFISGFLITASWLRSKSVCDYFIKRVLRIYPGFIVAMGFSAALIWAFCPEFRTFVHPLDWLWSLLKDLVLLDTKSISQADIFAGNPVSAVGNGSLWTISIEFSCYLFVLVIGLSGLLRWRLLILAAVVVGYRMCAMGMFNGNNRFDQFYLCFAMGAIAWLWRDKIPFSNWIACGCMVLLLGTSHFKPWFSIIFPLAGGYCLLWLAYGPRLLLANWAEKTDLSYGTYLYAFLIQQVLASFVALRHPWMLFILAAPLSLLFAWLSWNLVEKRFLAMKSRVSKLFVISKDAKLKGEKDDLLKIHDMATEQE